MATIARADGIQFVMQAYRETLYVKQRAARVTRIRQLAQQHGRYAIVEKLAPQELEVVLSKDTGYLLGETVRAYFDGEANLIFVEPTPSDEDLLLVIVKEGRIFLDTQIARDALRSELIPLTLDGRRYRVVTAGDVSLRDIETPDGFTLPEGSVASFTASPDSVFGQLPAYSKYRLQLTTQLFKSSVLGLRVTPGLIALGLALIAGVAWWYSAYHERAHQFAAKTVAAPAQMSNQGYYRALMTASPAQQLQELAATIRRLYLMPGWQTASLRFNGKDYHVQLRSDHGSLEDLMEWSHQKRVKMHVDRRGVWLSMVSKLPPRPRPKVIYPSQPLLSVFVDEVDEILHQQSVQLGAAKREGALWMMPLTINLRAASPNIIELLGKEFGGLPLSLKAADLTFDDGMINGTIRLSLWGKQ